MFALSFPTQCESTKSRRGWPMVFKHEGKKDSDLEPTAAGAEGQDQGLWAPSGREALDKRNRDKHACQHEPYRMHITRRLWYPENGESQRYQFEDGAFPASHAMSGTAASSDSNINNSNR